jgi:hypothetical protein
MIKPVMLVALGIVAGFSGQLLAEDHLMWPQSDAFYQGQGNQKSRTLDQVYPASGSVAPSPSFGYVPSQPNYAVPYSYYGQQGGANGYYPNPAMMGGQMPYYPPSRSNGFPDMGSFMPHMPNNFSFPNPANAMSGFNFPPFGR